MIELLTIDQIPNTPNVDIWTIISGILGIAGFIISLINLIHYFISHRVHLEITFLEYADRHYVKGNKRLLVHYQINNKSQLPVSITDIRVLVNNKLYTEDYDTHEILSYKHTGKDINEYVPTYNEHLPINLDCLHSHSGYIVFSIPEDVFPEIDKGLTFQIRTNRNKVIQTKFLPNELVKFRSTLLSPKSKIVQE